MSEAGQPRYLVISDAVRDTLAELRARSAVTTRTEVDLDQLHGVEEAFAVTLADDLLASFAAAVPALIDGYQWKLSMAIGHTGALLRRGGRGDLVGIGCDEQNNVYYCVDKSTDTDTTLIVFDAGSKKTTRVPLLEWLRQHLDGLPAEAPVPEFKPELVREMPGTPSGRRARHKKFGEGRVLSEKGEGPTRKVQVAFPNIGMKVLHARFLEFLDD